MPNQFGFVLTDSHPDTEVLLQLRHNGDLVASRLFPEFFGDANYNGNTDDDVFLGVTGSEIFDTVDIQTFYRNTDGVVAAPEIDHIQYGVPVPEPRSLALLFVGCIILRRDLGLVRACRYSRI